MVPPTTIQNRADWARNIRAGAPTRSPGGRLRSLTPRSGIGGRWWDSKVRDQRRARRIVRRKVVLAEKASALANDVLDLSDRVDLANDPTLSGRYRDAAADFREAESGIEQAQTMHDLDTVEARIDDLVATMRQVRIETR